MRINSLISYIIWSYFTVINVQSFLTKKVGAAFTLNSDVCVDGQGKETNFKDKKISYKSKRLF